MEIKDFIKFYWGKNFPKSFAQYKYWSKFHKFINWKNPKDLNEKINWLKFYGDNKSWVKLTDKFEVRKYVKEKGLSNILVHLYGVWDNVEDIDFSTLPRSFVLKSTHGCGTVLLVKDKEKMDVDIIKSQLKKWMTYVFGARTAEPHYIKIKARIIAEEYLDNDCNESTSIVDYKIWCLNGEPYCFMVCADREIGNSAQFGFYDLQWNKIPDMISGPHANNIVNVHKPDNIDELISIARKLAEGHPIVRVDLYDINGKVYFGELTFTSLGGYMDYISPKYLQIMGNLAKIQ